MADSSVAVLDATGTSRSVDVATVGSTFQQTVTIGDGTNAGRVAGIDSSGRLTVKATPIASTTGTITSVAGSATSVTLLAANANRLDTAIYNDSTAILYVAMASSATTTAYTFQLPAGAYWEQAGKIIYTGIITGIWASATGNARITEYT